MTSNYSYTGSPQTYTVPSGITSINIKAWGGGGGSPANLNATGGSAAMVEGDLAVTPGQVLTIDVAGGGISSYAGGAGGYGGGGNGSVTEFEIGAGGGGCTSIRNSSGTNLVMVAGGGGSGSYTRGAGYPMSSGGNGSGDGTSPGANGVDDSYRDIGSTNTGGRGAYYTSGSGNGGAGGLAYIPPDSKSAGSPGSFGAGGNGGNFSDGGGGSGWYGGGGGGGYGGGGGGGISLVTNLTNFTGYNGLAGVPNYGQPAGVGVGAGVGGVLVPAGGNGYVMISANAGVCFRGSTRVIMADRTFKAIKDIERGDEILTDKKTGATKKVARSLKYMATGKATEIPMHLIGNRRTIVCSSTHPFWVSDTRRILAGDIEGTETIQICEWLYTIQFEDEATYYVEGVKVDAVSPDHRKFKLPKELYFDQKKYKANRVMKSEDDERRKKPNMTKTL